MSARKIESVASSRQQITVAARQTRLTLTPEAVQIHRNGIEFHSATSFSLWTEMTVTLECPPEGKVDCTGVVVACAGTRHSGYQVSMVFTGMSKQSQARLNTLAYS
ncbi:MAG TPA: hypothetical protein VL527_12700 [Dongiaceae bacterium]|jgi:hypothetical protein|nr:hypothetical protein [Dongiaceae bacterium]